MKFKFSMERKFTPEWNGNQALPVDEQIHCTIKPMILGDMMVLMDSITASKVDGDKATISGEQAMKMVDAAKDIIPRYVQLSGLEDDDGPVSVEKITTYADYLPLAAEIIMACINSSTPSAATEGNSPAPPG